MARQIHIDWRVVRAESVLRVGGEFNVAFYADVFGVDEEETVAIFCEAAYRTGICFSVGAASTLH